MPKTPDARFPLPQQSFTQGGVVDLLGGVVRQRPLSGEEALAELKRIAELAQKGDLDARCRYALHLLQNPDEPRVNRRVLALLRPTLEANHVEGLYLMGLLTLRGQGLAQDLSAGADFIERAATLGHLPSQTLLARLYDQGLGREENPTKALYWYRLSGAAGEGESARLAGLAYVKGRGVAADKKLGQYWLEKAAQLGDSLAQFELSRLLKHHDKPQSEQKQGQYWLKESALTGTLEAQFRLGLQYWSGQGDGVNLRESLRWTCRAAEGGNLLAIATLAGFFLAGNILPINRFNAYILALYAERGGNSTAALTRQSLEPLLSYREKRRAVHFLKTTTDSKRLIETLIPRETR